MFVLAFKSLPNPSIFLCSTKKYNTILHDQLDM
ncbi:unnamed protein product [Acanthoscelides obtectus]|uniref:Uncharacterized protein n=1 Tax=Acanthoscelides obtectus TaxID=200917 RepID=A0A9P0KLV8_ACAOB|nr:unnamed protein product [Acanthoscelides obtectus]CAK1675138.1 hypothetical protein AOBTE_LOCUS29932 [Acanthoscelides obtectus]